VEPRDEPLDESLLREIPASTTVFRTPWVDVIERIKTVPCLGCVLSRGAGFTVRGPGEGTPRCSLTPSTAHSGVGHAAGTPTQTITAAIREWFSLLLKTPDSCTGWIVPAVRSGLSAVRRRRPDVIYSTAPYMSAHLIAMIVARCARLPWVADFRDPWHDNPFRQSQFPSLDRWDAALEWMALKSASHIVCNTPTMAERLCHRRPFVASRCSTILNGFDRERFEGLVPRRAVAGGDFILTHSGQFYGPRSPRVWLSALRRLSDAFPTLARRTHLVLLGAETYEGRRLSDWAAEAGVADRVRVLGRKTHAEALACMAGSDALVLAGLAGPGSELQVPNKLFEYLALRRPIIVTCTSTSPVVTILKEARAEALICDPGDAAGLAAAIAQLATRRRLDLQDAWSGVDRFDRALRAAELVGIFRRVSRRGVVRSSRVLKSAAIPAQAKSGDRRVSSTSAVEAAGAAWSATALHTCE
jgi:glycosyltransferase involved in cell wall biosynthesis